MFLAEQFLQHWQDSQRNHVKTGRVQVLLRITGHVILRIWKATSRTAHLSMTQRRRRRPMDC
jgi:hypothetical protein